MSVSARARLAWLLVAVLGVQVGYDFLFLPYRELLVSDMGYFWERALNHLAGRTDALEQWVVWPVFPHIFMAWTIKLADALGLSGHRLEFYLVTVAMLHVSAVYAVFRAGLALLASEGAALMAALLYGLFPPMLHLNGHVLSEGYAQPALVWALCLLLWRPLGIRLVLLAGALFGLAAAMRPAYGLFGLVLAGVIAVRVSDWKLWLGRALALFVGFLGPVLAESATVSHLSAGRIHGLGGNGALVFFMHQCRPGGWAIVNPLLLKGEDFNDCALYRRIHPPLARSMWVKTSMDELKACNGRIYGQPPALMEFADRPFLVTPWMPWNKRFFFELGLSCIQHRGLWRQLREDVWQTRKLFVYFFPDQVFDDGHGGIRYGTWLGLILMSNLLFFAAGLLLPWWFRLRGRWVPPELLVCTALPLLAYLTSMVFAIDGRYLAPTAVTACWAMAMLRAPEHSASEVGI